MYLLIKIMYVCNVKTYTFTGYCQRRFLEGRLNSLPIYSLDSSKKVTTSSGTKPSSVCILCFCLCIASSVEASFLLQ